ncbi:AAA family ATPase [uncultured Clostridium sp.]|uniref:ParA family protein n=1 Tax=uncultured Clostridium sp. TaxID=59620 RepID=UPI0025ED523B|nr:AAA family ATPase [uncultured Clostridium sp.]
MKTICVFNQKGGVGKTTTNINLATYLAFEGKKVLIVDIDPQGNSTSGLGIDKSNLEFSTYDILTNDTNIEECIIKSELIENLYVIPSEQALAGAEVELTGINHREDILKRKLELVRDKFDFVFIDCPPSLGLLTINALVASDSVFIPIQCEYYALEGVSQLINTINLVKKSLNPDIKYEGILLTMYDTRANLCNEVAKEVKNHFGDYVYKTVIPRNVRLAESPSYGLPIMLYDAKCKGAESYDMLAKEFLSRQEE